MGAPLRFLDDFLQNSAISANHRPGFLVSIIISPRLGSKLISVISASDGNQFSRDFFCFNLRNPHRGVRAYNYSFANNSNDFSNYAALVNQNLGFLV